MEVLQRRAPGADDHDLAGNRVAREAAVVHARVGERAHRARRPGEVDRHRWRGPPKLAADTGARRPRHRHAERLQALDRVLRGADRAVAVRDHARVAGSRTQLAQHVVAAEHVRAPVRPDDRRAEDRVAGPPDRVDQRVVVGLRVGSVNWTSNAITLAPARRSRSITRAW